jgi:hypothetical protein
LYYPILSEDIQKVKKILNIIGTPFNIPQQIEVDHFGCIDLYNIARRNKIGLLFLESLSRCHSLPKELTDELNKQREIHKILQVTATRVAEIFHTVEYKYAMIKSNYPFSAVPNDIDVLVFGTHNEYRNVINLMKSSNFQLVANEAPLEACLHDSTRSPKHRLAGNSVVVKDPFDVDFYKEVGAGHIIYMDKGKLIDKISKTSINGITLNVLKFPADVALSIFHSIYPERLYTLLLHFHILHMIKNMSAADMNEFLEICFEHKLSSAANLALNLTQTIQETCFSQSPLELVHLREGLGKNQTPIKLSKLPYLYSIQNILDVFWGKKMDRVFTISIIKQLMSMLNPKYSLSIINVHKERSKRDTY